jgi:hypothetical protein
VGPILTPFWREQCFQPRSTLLKTDILRVQVFGSIRDSTVLGNVHAITSSGEGTSSWKNACCVHRKLLSRSCSIPCSPFPLRTLCFCQSRADFKPFAKQTQDALAVAEGEPTTLNGTTYTCRCPESFPILRVMVYSHPHFMVPMPLRTFCAHEDGWVDTRVPIPVALVSSAKFVPLGPPSWCCNVSCTMRCQSCYVPHHSPADIPSCDLGLPTYAPPPPPPGPFFYPNHPHSHP